MSEELRRLGQMLKDKRVELNLSLKEVENATSIRSAYLEAIEDGRIRELLSGVYAIGFVRQYASCLGIDFDALAKENPQVFKLPAEKHEFSYGIGTLEVRGSMGGGVKWLPNLIWASVVALVIVLAWYFAKFIGVF